MSKIILTVLKEDFDGAAFLSPWRCALANAANRQFDAKDAGEGTNHITVNKKSYSHRLFTYEEHEHLKAIAAKSEPGSVIFTIELASYEPI